MDFRPMGPSLEGPTLLAEALDTFSCGRCFSREDPCPYTAFSPGLCVCVHVCVCRFNYAMTRRNTHSRSGRYHSFGERLWFITIGEYPFAGRNQP